MNERAGVDKNALLQIDYVLRILLELCFLKSMGMDAEAIKRLAGTCARYAQIRQRFFPKG